MTETTDLTMARLCAASYLPLGAEEAKDLGQTFVTSGVWWAVSVDGPVTRIIFRGSADAEDWARDFRPLPMPSFRHLQLGLVHVGFLAGMEAAYAAIKPRIRTDVVWVGGHSLGAARAAILTAFFVADKSPLSFRRVVFGEPKSAAAHPLEPGMNALLLDHHVSNVSYRNTDGRGEWDHVTDLPIGPLFSTATERTDIVTPAVVAPAPELLKGMFGLHHMPLYLAAMEARA